MELTFLEKRIKVRARERAEKELSELKKFIQNNEFATRIKIHGKKLWDGSYSNSVLSKDNEDFLKTIVGGVKPILPKQMQAEGTADIQDAEFNDLPF